MGLEGNPCLPPGIHYTDVRVHPLRRFEAVRLGVSLSARPPASGARMYSRRRPGYYRNTSNGPRAGYPLPRRRKLGLGRLYLKLSCLPSRPLCACKDCSAARPPAGRVLLPAEQSARG